MYRLLIVTDDTNATDMFSAMDCWGQMGFQPPTLLGTVEEAVEALQKRRVDAIALPQAPAYDALYAYLNEHFPDLPVLAIEADEAAQRDAVWELYRLLVRIGADDSNDEYDDISRMQQIREKWLKKVMGGMVPSRLEMGRQARLYRLREKLDVPCMLARLQMPEDDTFLSERWHYGSDRLETALRNFFGHEHARMILHVAVISPQEVRVLCYPADEAAGVNEESACAYVRETLEQVEKYLGLRLNVLEMSLIPGLNAFAGGGAW